MRASLIVRLEKDMEMARSGDWRVRERSQLLEKGKTRNDEILHSVQGSFALDKQSEQRIG